MGIIRKLPDLVANKIAAGEVIERPASVVKELVENAIDAESSRIEVELEDGGKRLIRVSDNGTGMAADDLLLAVQSHATSKLKDSDDLFFITTLGFRGEALPSVGAVSELRITSRLRGCDSGSQIEVAGGKIVPVKAAGVPEGTIIEVRNLFFNIPARRKFLKTTSTELSHAVDIITKAALAYPSVSFRLVHNGREMINCLQNEDRLRRISNFFGKELQTDLLEVNSGEGPLMISGYIAPPSQTRANTKLQYVFLNGRFIRDKSIASAVRAAYEGQVPAGRQPIVILFLQIDPREVDVNVHPTKYEVRFRDSHLVYTTVRRIIGAKLASTPAPELIVRHDTPPEAPERDARVPSDWNRKIRRDPALFEVSFLTTQRPAAAPSAPPQPPGRQQSATVQYPQKAALPPRPTAPQHPQEANLPPRPAAPQHPQEANLPPRPAAPQHPQEANLPPRPAPRSAQPPAADDPLPVDPHPHRPQAFQVHDTYIIEQTAGGIRIIDQHALHERIIYSQIRRRMETTGIESQRLLIPVTVELTSDEVILLTGAAGEMRALGFEIEEFGRNVVALRTVPVMLLDCDPEQFLHEMIAALQEENGGSATGGKRAPELRESLVKMIACKAAVKANQRLTFPEISSLLQKGRELGGEAATCPHGRPTSLTLSCDELEKHFLRR